MTHAYKPASKGATVTTGRSPVFIVFDEDSLEQEGVYNTEEEARRRCDRLNRSATDNPAPGDVHPEQKM
ncbi:hypothetical protein [Kushneria konosiri]|nr:hypothetical protein [Kushneria konosiri]